MRDPFKREVRSLRISVTPHCNLRCFYCHREGYNNSKDRSMTPEEIGEIVRAFLDFGIRKIKISGGEPLLREDLPEILENISNPRIEEISLTTNGTLLERYAQVLKDAGLHRVNVSLDTLDPEKYRQITGYGDVNVVKAGIERAIEVGLTPLKINYLVMKNTLEDLEDLMDYCREVGAILQVIELMPLDKTLRRYYVDITPIEKRIEEMADKVVKRRWMHNRRKYYIGDLEVEFVKPMDNTEFCRHCTRIRLTYDGYIKPCLLREDNLVDILTPLRRGEDIKEYIREGILRREPYFKL
ncbi:MAG TPA: GTP 3',8-cyclase MoaA [Methanothermococcus okinawensis]|uniref:Probable GTP 3',8-cyclase n=1 Tax=Methanothermococcus okinawensis TaxID=155863 RepID=A0A832ZYS0_9EURY|nr:GTP 3',8-cyclase MoaA [Methanothermococcus okinawensis]